MALGHCRCMGCQLYQGSVFWDDAFRVICLTTYRTCTDFHPTAGFTHDDTRKSPTLCRRAINVFYCRAVLRFGCTAPQWSHRNTWTCDLRLLPGFWPVGLSLGHFYGESSLPFHFLSTLTPLWVNPPMSHSSLRDFFWLRCFTQNNECQLHGRAEGKVRGSPTT